MLTTVAVAFGTLMALEPVMALVHRFLFHGPLWCSHKSHHEHPAARRIVRNDLLWVWPLMSSAVLIAVGGPVLTGIGIGTSTYVAAYILAHDGVAHGRFRVPAMVRRNALLQRVAHTHRLHHRGGRAGVGAPPFGIYSAALEHRWRLSDSYSPPTKICSPA